jgi:hypothetical protein
VISIAAADTSNVAVFVFVTAFTPEEGERLGDVESGSKDGVLNAAPATTERGRRSPTDGARPASSRSRPSVLCGPTTEPHRAGERRDLIGDPVLHALRPLFGALDERRIRLLREVVHG